MWNNVHKDYKKDGQWTLEKVEPGSGIVGCEMHEINGWQNLLHVKQKKKRGPLSQLARMFRRP